MQLHLTTETKDNAMEMRWIELQIRRMSDIIYIEILWV